MIHLSQVSRTKAVKSMHTSKVRIRTVQAKIDYKEIHFFFAVRGLKMITGGYKWYQINHFMSSTILGTVFLIFFSKNGPTTADNVKLKYPDFQT